MSCRRSRAHRSSGNRKPDYEGAFALNVLAEYRHHADPLHQAAVDYLERRRSGYVSAASAAGITNSEDFGHQWFILVTGAMISALAGDTEAAQRAKKMGRLLLEQYLPHDHSELVDGNHAPT